MGEKTDRRRDKAIEAPVEAAVARVESEGDTGDAACAVNCSCVGTGTQCVTSLALNGDGATEGAERELPSDEELRKNFRVHLDKAEADGDIDVLTRLIIANIGDANRYQVATHVLFGIGIAEEGAKPEAFSAISALLLQEHSPGEDGWFLDKYSVEPINIYNEETAHTDAYEEHQRYVYRLAELKRYLVGFIMGHMVPFKKDPIAAFFILSTIKPSPAIQTSVVEELQSGGMVVRDALTVLKNMKAHYYLALLIVQAETGTIRKSCAAYMDMYLSEITDTETLQVLTQCRFPVAEAARKKLEERGDRT
ncbi:hypothetical protein A3B60_00175 [Candidatus Peregrinibacteria bacterium RIFCSPLOWO2_01_FULL_39_12]|nr:MAG: hypothetical protein A3B60_00175 [Candidatus Peregrinibacteria bacterium RIFCSPLOWO2_01_FULL_39_12]OGJ43366.1 MAG: hypothetical protein A3I58_02355 [Candidatus Peregrinibacteria bacterium RIFCSPLOWO2_02_FULL_39_10]